MVEILNDAWNLYIDSQDNGDENVILGVSVDKVSQNENVNLTLGNEEKEVSPCCVILCVTIDGKVSVFHFASAAGALVSPEGTSFDEEDDADQVPPEGTGTNATLSPSSHVDIRVPEQTVAKNMVQKPLVISQTLKVDEPEKSTSKLSNQDNYSENQSVSGVESSSGFLSGRVTFDKQINSEPLGKVPSFDSPSTWSLARSSAGVGTSKTSEGRFLSVSSGEVDKSDRHVFQSAGGALQHPRDLKEKANPSANFTSVRQTTLTPEWSRQSQLPLRDGVASGKSFQAESRKDLNATSLPKGLPYSAQSASKQFGNVEEMARKLDNLLEDIEGKGGFRDSSITSHTKFVTELEDGIWTLSDRCRMLRGLMDEQLREAQLLLDKTVQVSVRKVYLEGIFKQATDSRYWELWNRQKLSSELELKRRRVLDLNQELANKLIELERHFNSLELNRFGENGEMQRNRRVVQNSRQIQSLHSLHNTMNAQLAAAEHLSGCLSKQMAALSIGPSGKNDVKKKLFESIGLSYVGDSQIHPDRDRTCVTPPNKEQLITSSSVATKEHSRRTQASFSKSREPDTARRLHDSLDRSWASFEPPKTTVERRMKEDYEKGRANQSLINIDKQYISPQSQKKSGFAHSALSNVSEASFNNYQSKGTAETPVKQFMETPSTSLLPRTAGPRDRENQVSSTRSFSVFPPSSISEMKTTQNSEMEAFKPTNEKSKNTLPFTGNNDSFAASEPTSVHQSVSSFRPLPSMSTWLPEQSLESPSISTDISDRSNTGIARSTTSDHKNSRFVSETPLFPAFAFSSGPNLSEKGLFSKSLEKPSQSHDRVSSSTPLHSAFGSSLVSSTTSSPLSSFVSKPSSPTLFPATPSASEASVVAKQEVSRPQTSVLSTPNFSSTLPSSTPESHLSTLSTSSGIVKSESLTSLPNPNFTMHGSKTEGALQTQTSLANTPSKVEKDVKIETSASQPGLAISESDLKFDTPVSSTSTELSTNSIAGNQIDFGGSLKSSSIIAPIEAPNEGTVGSVKTVVSDTSHEEEMEEEASEINQTTEFALGNLGGFGIGSTPNSSTPKSNPFGVAVNKDTTSFSSPYTMSPTNGELFRPASFSFQSPQAPQPLQPTAAVNFSGGFSTGNSGQTSAVSGFGQPAHVGAGQQALGSVLGSFGQSRQLGAGLAGSSVTSSSGFGGGFTGVSAGGFGGGFTSACTGGGFSSLATPGGGFAAAATGVGGFGAAATGGGGFAAVATGGGGFAAAATGGGGFAGAATGGGGFGGGSGVGGGFASSATAHPVSGGFGAFGNQQGGGGFSAFGGGSGSARPPSELFTQMRK